MLLAHVFDDPSLWHVNIEVQQRLQPRRTRVLMHLDPFQYPRTRPADSETLPMAFLDVLERRYLRP
jgi:hypothetical protein